MTTAKFPPRGGGRYLSPNAYTVRGVSYQPVDGPGYVAIGEASWYGQDFHGRRTANGEIFGAYYLTAASPVLPVPSYARVTNLENGRSVMVRINDRGPYMQGRIADVSYETAQVLGFADTESWLHTFRHVNSTRMIEGVWQIDPEGRAETEEAAHPVQRQAPGRRAPLQPLEA